MWIRSAIARAVTGASTTEGFRERRTSEVMVNGDCRERLERRRDSVLWEEQKGQRKRKKNTKKMERVKEIGGNFAGDERERQSEGESRGRLSESLHCLRGDKQE